VSAAVPSAEIESQLAATPEVARRLRYEFSHASGSVGRTDEKARPFKPENRRSLQLAGPCASAKGVRESTPGFPECSQFAMKVCGRSGNCQRLASSVLFFSQPRGPARINFRQTVEAKEDLDGF
jgi:hypothetical protein